MKYNFHFGSSSESFNIKTDLIKTKTYDWGFLFSFFHFYLLFLHFIAFFLYFFHSFCLLALLNSWMLGFLCLFMWFSRRSHSNFYMKFCFHFNFGWVSLQLFSRLSKTLLFSECETIFFFSFFFFGTCMQYIFIFFAMDSDSDSDPMPFAMYLKTSSLAVLSCICNGWRTCMWI